MRSPNSSITLQRSHPSPALSGQFTVIEHCSSGLFPLWIKTASSQKIPMNEVKNDLWKTIFAGGQHISSASFPASWKANVGPPFSLSPIIREWRMCAKCRGNDTCRLRVSPTICCCPRHESENYNVSTSDFTRQNKIILIKLNINKNKKQN